MTIEEIIQDSVEYANDVNISAGAPLQVEKEQLLQYLQDTDDTIDDFQLATAIDAMISRGIVRHYDGVFIFFNEGEEDEEGEAEFFP